MKPVCVFLCSFSLSLETGDSPDFFFFCFLLVTGTQQSNSVVCFVLWLLLKVVEIKARPQCVKACRQCSKQLKHYSACKLVERRRAVFRQLIIALGTARGSWC